jgi:uncharacterized membrane protein YcaP (DUF421 family)
MKTFTELIGEGPDLTALQVSIRAVIVFGICLLFLRLAGKRAFGMRMPADNVLAVLLGSVLSRAVNGSSPFFPTLLAGIIIVVLYRICSLLGVYSKLFGRIVKGEEKLLYKNGQLLEDNMKQCMVTHKDLYEEIRIKVNTDSLEKVEKIYLERNGEISVLLKEKEQDK